MWLFPSSGLSAASFFLVRHMAEAAEGGLCLIHLWTDSGEQVGMVKFTSGRRSFCRCLAKWFPWGWLVGLGGSKLPSIGQRAKFGPFLFNRLGIKWFWHFLSEKAGMCLFIVCYNGKWCEIWQKINKHENATFTLFKIFLIFHPCSKNNKETQKLEFSFRRIFCCITFVLVLSVWIGIQEHEQNVESV